MKLSERFFAVGLLTTAMGVACTGGVAPVQVGGPGPSDGEAKEGKPPGGGSPGQPQTSAQQTTSGSGTPTSSTTTSAQGPTTSSGSGTSSSTGSACTENPGCKTCAQCISTPALCGTPSQAATTVCKCNGATTMSKKASLVAYDSLAACICGMCAAQCTKTCTGSGSDTASCNTCENSAVGGSCMTQLTDCEGA